MVDAAAAVAMVTQRGIPRRLRLLVLQRSNRPIDRRRPRRSHRRRRRYRRRRAQLFRLFPLRRHEGRRRFLWRLFVFLVSERGQRPLLLLHRRFTCPHKT